MLLEFGWSFAADSRIAGAGLCDGHRVGTRIAQVPSVKGYAMSIALLKYIEGQKSLPVNVTDAGEVDALRLLRAADLVAAMVVRETSAEGAGRHIGRVLAITAKGRVALRESA
jgi:hypothetical protein